MDIKERINAFVELGSFLKQFADEDLKKTGHKLNSKYYREFKGLLSKVSVENQWFTPVHVHASIKGICKFLEESKIEKWLNAYNVSDHNTGIRIAVIMAGNIPMVGFHDMMCVVMAGHTFIGKLSSKDNQLLDFIAKLLADLNSEFAGLIKFQLERLSGENSFDAIIATGSNNSARYFDAYFSKFPNITRRNRNSVAVLTGAESEKDLKALGNDIFLYFGLGCRNVSKIYIPENYNITKLFEHWKNFATIIDQSKYANNYNYQHSLLLMNRIHHFDKGFLLLQEKTDIASPVGVVYYEYYSEINEIEYKLSLKSDLIQCIVSSGLKNAIPFGMAQEPQLWDYADHIDTMQFLTNLNENQNHDI